MLQMPAVRVHGQPPKRSFSKLKQRKQAHGAGQSANQNVPHPPWTLKRLCFRHLCRRLDVYLTLLQPPVPKVQGLLGERCGGQGCSNECACLEEWAVGGLQPARWLCGVATHGVLVGWSACSACLRTA